MPPDRGVTARSSAREPGARVDGGQSRFHRTLVGSGQRCPGPGPDRPPAGKSAPGGTVCCGGAESRLSTASLRRHLHDDHPALRRPGTVPRTSSAGS